MNRKKIVIIGGGLSGVLTALKILAIENGTEVILLEKDPEKLGRGVAYQHEFTHQPLNVVAGAMSLYADNPDDFVNWLQINFFRYKHLIPEVSSNTFIPRKIFGDYVVERLKETHDKLEGRFQIRIDEAISILGNKNHRTVVLGSGITLQANHVVLALGNFPPADVIENISDFKNHDLYFSNPWTDKVYQNIKGNENILLIGTGLTAVDVVLGLHLRNFEGKIFMLSRKGRLPLPHFIAQQTYIWKDEFLMPPKELYQTIRKNIRGNKEVMWTQIIDSLRPHLQSIWSFWSVEQKSYFMKRLRQFWEIARHRIPNASSKILDEMIISKQLNIGRGKIIEIKNHDNGLEATFVEGLQTKTNVFQRIINCTGPESNYRKIKFPIIQDLMERNKVVPDELGLGIMCTKDGKILNKLSEIEEGLWCIGPMRKAILWETTGLREIREQAVELAQTIGN